MTKTAGSSKGGTYARRAPRYLIEAPVRFRSPEGQWNEGTTVNICSLGLLIRTANAPAPSTSLELRIALSPEGSMAGADVACTGRVLRSEQPPGAAEALVAVTIDRFQFTPAAREPGDGAVR
ncbi:MAG TPA: PilZ domain-containing protein [Vicinamibacterales bacterium]|nr:PilZ domain-containing protein [Vicinamibacterales bacterium]